MEFNYITKILLLEFQYVTFPEFLYVTKIMLNYQKSITLLK